MIVNIEQVIEKDKDGKVKDENKPPRLTISYINNEGLIKYLNYNIPESEMYVWKYAKSSQRHMADPVFKSWDWKPVIKEKTKIFLPESRIGEILYELIRQYPQANVINELYTPDLSYTDIEVDVDDDGFPEAETAKMPINTISWVHNDEVTVLSRKTISENDIKWIQNSIDEHCKGFKTKYKFKFEYYPNEVDLLNKYFYAYMGPSAAITGWNYLGYDYPYLYNRYKNLTGIQLESILSPTHTGFRYKGWKSSRAPIMLPKHKLLFDYMEVFDKWDRIVDPKESSKLDWVSEKVLGIKKVVHQLGFKQEWEQKPVEYIFYNAVDSILVRELDLALKTSAAFYGLANLMHIPALTAFSPVRSIESVQVEYLYKENRVMPVIERVESKAEDYEGAFVFQPQPGIYHNVLALDYSSLYPTTMRQFNISPDTFICKDKNHVCGPNEISTATGAIFRRDVEGFIPRILDDYFAKRKAYKKEMLIAYEEKEKLEHIYERRFKSTVV